MSSNKRYLSSIVYADFDGVNIILYLGDGNRKRNFIYLEPEVFTALINYKEG